MLSRTDPEPSPRKLPPPVVSPTVSGIFQAMSGNSQVPSGTFPAASENSRAASGIFPPPFNSPQPRSAASDHTSCTRPDVYDEYRTGNLQHQEFFPLTAFSLARSNPSRQLAPVIEQAVLNRTSRIPITHLQTSTLMPANRTFDFPVSTLLRDANASTPPLAMPPPDLPSPAASPRKTRTPPSRTSSSPHFLMPKSNS